MVAGLKEIDLLISNEVYNPMLLRDPPRPGAWR